MAETNILAARLHGRDDLRLEKIPAPKPGPKDLQVGVGSVGLCGTDVYMLREGGATGFTLNDPIILGHETAGTVTGVGAQVTDFKIGDRVAIELGMPCRTCAICKSGRYNLCKGFSIGGLTNVTVYPADFCHKLPENMSVEEGALCEPLAVSVHAVRRAGLQMGDTVVVGGAGPVGLLVAMVAGAAGATRVLVTDLSESRLALARKLGVTDTLLVTSRDGPEIAQQIQHVLGGRADRSIDCCGAQSSLQALLLSTESGGVLVTVALDPAEVALPLVDAASREVDIKGAFSSHGSDYSTAVSLIASGKLNVKPLVTQRYRLSEVHAAFDLVRSNAEGVFKVMVDCSL